MSNGNVARKFRTKTGRCTVMDDRLLLANEGFRGLLAKVLFGSIWQASILYSILGVICLKVGLQSIAEANLMLGGFLCLVGSAWIVMVLSLLHSYSATSEIMKSAIDMFEAHPPREWLTRPYFVVWFRQGNRRKKRLIMLPGSLFDGRNEFNKATAILTEEGFLSSQS